MNINLVLSFFIAGILLMSILSMNNNLSQSSTQLAMQQFVQQRINTVGELLQNDIPKIGYSETEAIPGAITVAESQEIQFQSDIDNNGTEDVIIWRFDPDPVLSTPNPADSVLIRSINSIDTEIKTGVTEFEIKYLNKDRKELASPNANRDKIQHINISVTIESPETVDQDGERYLKTNWSRTFTPINLTL